VSSAEKVAIVTGASKGIGAAIPVGSPTRRRQSPSTTLQARLTRIVWSTRIVCKGGKAAPIQADVTKSADFKASVRRDQSKARGAQLLVNNAGVFTFGPIEAATEEDFHRQFDTNVLETLLATREAVSAFDGKAAA